MQGFFRSLLILALMLAIVGCGSAVGRGGDPRLADLQIRHEKWNERRARFDADFRRFWDGLSTEQMAWLKIASEESSDEATAGLLQSLTPAQTEDLRRLAERKRRLETRRLALLREAKTLGTESAAIRAKPTGPGGLLPLFGVFRGEDP